MRKNRGNMSCNSPRCDIGLKTETPFKQNYISINKRDVSIKTDIHLYNVSTKMCSDETG